MSKLKDNDKKKILTEFNSQKRELNKIVNNWGLIPDSPIDEFDHLSSQILSHLWKGAERSKIQRVIQSEIVTRYGIDCEIEESMTFSKEIYDWWIYRK